MTILREVHTGPLNLRVHIMYSVQYGKLTVIMQRFTLKFVMIGFM